MKYSELLKQMSDFNTKHGILRKVDIKKDDNGNYIEMIGRVVISNSVLNKEYPIEERTYEFSNYNKALTSDDGGYSIFAICNKDNDMMRIEHMSDKDIESAEIVSVNE